MVDQSRNNHIHFELDGLRKMTYLKLVPATGIESRTLGVKVAETGTLTVMYAILVSQHSRKPNLLDRFRSWLMDAR